MTEKSAKCTRCEHVYSDEGRLMGGRLLFGDCVEVMAAMDEASIDAIATDSPYGLEFMGAEWDKLGGDAGMVKPYNSGHAQQAWHHRWAVQALRILKPGGHLVAFGGTRTYHRLVCALEDAGFEIRDSLHWMYGTGFPKSLNVGRAIDKTAPATPDAATWEGWGTALKPAHEPIVLARKPLIGTVAKNVLAHGTGALNIDACRMSTDDNLNGGAYSKGASERHDKAENWRMKRGEHGNAGNYKQPSGRWPPNILLTHSAACKVIGTRQIKGDDRKTVVGGGQDSGGFMNVGAARRSAQPGGKVHPSTTVPDYACVPGCPVAALDVQSGASKSTGGRIGNAQGIYTNQDRTGWGTGHKAGDPGFGDIGGASRFFPSLDWNPEYDAPFLYQAKPPKKERERGKPDTFVAKHGPKKRWNTHVTVKPVSLMRWLIRLVTPPGGTVLDPFAGSGTTGIAAYQEGFDFILIEREAAYIPIIEGRIIGACI